MNIFGPNHSTNIFKSFHEASIETPSQYIWPQQRGPWLLDCVGPRHRVKGG
jgi:hypothetical protein